jgi:hypothetical protein
MAGTKAAQQPPPYLQERWWQEAQAGGDLTLKLRDGCEIKVAKAMLVSNEGRHGVHGPSFPALAGGWLYAS